MMRIPEDYFPDEGNILCSFRTTSVEIIFNHNDDFCFASIPNVRYCEAALMSSS